MLKFPQAEKKPVLGTKQRDQNIGITPEKLPWPISRNLATGSLALEAIGQFLILLS